MFGECHAHVIMDGINYKAAVAASICFLSAPGWSWTDSQSY